MNDEWKNVWKVIKTVKKDTKSWMWIYNLKENKSKAHSNKRMPDGKILTISLF